MGSSDDALGESKLGCRTHTPGDLGNLLHIETARILDLDPRTVRTKVDAWTRRQRGGKRG
jgi:hypothetical protein